MSKVYRLGVASMSHDHVWGELDEWVKTGCVEIVAASDDEPELLEKIKTKYGVAKHYRTVQEMLANEQLDFVQAAGGNNEGAEIVEAAAAKGIHVISEKPMASTYAIAKRMLEASEKAGTLLLINWPTAWHADWQELAIRVIAGEIGDVRYVRYRSAHSGPVAIGCSQAFVRDLTTPEINGAGALMDYCCYGANLTALLLGEPSMVTGMRGVFGNEPAYIPSDDNAIILSKFDHAFAVCEASWSQPVSYAEVNPLVYGSKGSLAINHGKLNLQLAGQASEVITPSELAFPNRSAPEYIIHCLENRQPIEGFCSPKVSLISQSILQRGLDSANSGTAN